MHFFTFRRLSDMSSSKDNCALHTLARIKVSLPNSSNSNSIDNNSNEIVLPLQYFSICVGPTNMNIRSMSREKFLDVEWKKPWFLEPTHYCLIIIFCIVNLAKSFQYG